MARPLVNKGKQKPEPLYAVYRNGVRVYLPPKGQVGVDLRRAEVIAAGLPGSEIVCVFDPEEEHGQAA